jgi:hypothetical protein
MSLHRRIGRRAETLRELAAFLYERRLWWMIPMVGVVLLVGALVVLTQGSALAPLFYPLF